MQTCLQSSLLALPRQLDLPAYCWINQLKMSLHVLF